MRRFLLILLLFPLSVSWLPAQNSIVGDGFGGRLWYKPTNYSQASYAGFARCGSDSQLYGWGDNLMGVLGTGNNTHHPVPVQVPGMTGTTYVTGGYIAAGIRSNGSGYTWGTPYADYIKGQFYNMSPVKLLDSARHCFAGQSNVAFVKTDGTVWCYGIDKWGQFGNGVKDWTSATKKFVQMKNITHAVRVALTDQATAVLFDSGTVYVAGDNGKGLLGQANPPSYSALPIRNPYLKNIVDIKAANMGFCALDKNGFVYTWGYHRYGLVGDDDTSSSSQIIPKKNPYLKNIIAISGSNDGWHFMALDSAKNVWAWGMNLKGSCGVPMGPVMLHPQLVATDAIDIMAGETYSMIVKSDGSLWMAGGSGWANIWLNLKDSNRANFTKVDPTAAGINICPPQLFATRLQMKHTGRCEGERFRFTGSSNISGSTYQIRYRGIIRNSDTFSVIPKINGKDTLYFYAKDPANKTDSLQYIFQVNPKPRLQITIDDSIQCIRNNLFSFDFIQKNGVVPAGYSWKFLNGSVLNQHPVQRSFTKTGIFKVTLTANSDSLCTDSWNSWYVLLNSPTAAFTAEIINSTGNSVKLSNQSFPAPLKIWYQLGPYGNAFRDTQISAKILNSFYAKLIVTDTNGCSDSTGKYINFSYPVYVWFPNAFSPGKNKLNDLFIPVHSGELMNYSLKIFNRWGEKLFQSENSTEGWDGRANEADCQEGVYVYMASFSDITGKEYKFRGTFHLLRPEQQ